MPEVKPQVKPIWFRKPNWSGYIRATKHPGIPFDGCLQDAEVLGYVRRDDGVWALYVNIYVPGDGYARPFVQDSFYRGQRWPVCLGDVLAKELPDGQEAWPLKLYGDEDTPRAKWLAYWDHFHAQPKSAPEPEPEPAPKKSLWRRLFTRIKG